MNASSIRRIQGVCFALCHIPLAATAAVLAADGLQGDMTPIAATLVATLVTALALTVYLGRALPAAASRTDEIAFKIS